MILPYLFLLHSFAFGSINVEHIQLSNPTYVQMSKLDLALNRDVIEDVDFFNSSIFIEFELSAGKKISENFEIALSEKRNCLLEGVCSIQRVIPIQYFSRSCSIRIQFKTPSKMFFEYHTAWGRCKPYGTHLRRDISLDQSQIHLEKSTLEIPSELGDYRVLKIKESTQDNMLIALGFDFDGNISWSSKFKWGGEFRYSSDISPAQFRKLCKVVVLVDYLGDIPDDQLQNNLVSIPFGNCFSGVKKRFVDLSGIEEDKVLYIYNQSDVPTRLEAVSVDFILYNSKGDVLMRFKKFTGKTLGFMEFEKMDLSHLFSAELCRVEVTVNGNHAENEENYTNNKINIDKCDYSQRK